MDSTQSDVIVVYSLLCAHTMLWSAGLRVASGLGFLRATYQQVDALQTHLPLLQKGKSN